MPDPNDNAAANHRNPLVEAEWCRVCNKAFASLKALHVHKVQETDHFCCPVCSRDFHSKDAVKRHYNQNHATAQSLPCPGCSTEFSRVGALVSHIEMGSCPAISAEEFSKVRQEKTKWHSDQHNAQVVAHYGAEYEGMAQDTKVSKAGDVSHPRHVPSVQPHTAPAPTAPGDESSSDSHGEGIRLDIEGKPLILESSKMRDDWGRENEPKPQKQEDYAQVFADHWDRSQRKANVKESRNFSSLTPNDNGKPNPAWTTEYDHEKKLIPETHRTHQPPPQASTWATEPSNSQEPNNDEWTEDDPNHPKFKVARYFVSITRKYKCPHTGCRKSLEAPKAFIEHLKSHACMDSQLQCSSCLRYFGSATALAQHYESQAVKCRMRERRRYGAALDAVTAGTVALGGHHTDGTIRCVANSLGAPGRGSQHLAQAHRVARTARDEERDECEEGKIP